MSSPIPLRTAFTLTESMAAAPFRPGALARVASGFFLLYAAISVQSVEGQERFEHGLAQCRAIPAEAYETGLLFNPPGHRTYFKRARCLQRLAVEWRDRELCSSVRERRSWFFSGSAISEEACTEAVASRISEDRARVAAIRIEDFHRMGQVRFTHSEGANHLLLQFETNGRYPGTYQVRVEVWPPNAGESVVIDDYSQPLGTSDHSLTRSIPLDRLGEMTGVWPAASPRRARVTLELPPRSHADHHTLALIPVEERRSTVEARIEILTRDHR